MNKIYLLVILNLIQFCISAQPAFEQHPDTYFTMLSPQAISLKRTDVADVSLSRGTATASIPIYEIKVGNFRYPISLDYAATGIGVEDVASWVGTGWNLSAGGAVIRGKRGVNDEAMLAQYAEKLPLYTQFEDPNIPITTKQDLEWHLGSLWGSSLPEPTFNMESDIFSFITGNVSGKFFLDYTGHAHEMPSAHKDIYFSGKIRPVPTKEFFEKWVITDKDGVKYVFGNSLSGESNESYEVIRVNSDCSNVDENNAQVNTWYLSEIILPNDQKITFHYEPYSFCATAFGADDVDSKRTAITYIIGRRLKEIIFDEGKVVFEKGGCREDLNRDYTLKYIKIFSKTGSEYSMLKYFELKTNSNEETSCFTTDYSFRLRLDQILEFGKNTSVKPNIYSFAYYASEDDNTLGLPSRSSEERSYYSQDIFGFYNGKINAAASPYPRWGKTLDPGIGIKYIYYHGTGTSDRAIYPGHAKTGSLKSITNPFGGITTFEYENNTVGPPPVSRLNSTNQEIAKTIADLETFCGFPSTEQPRNASLLPELYPGYQEKIQYGPAFQIGTDGFEYTVKVTLAFQGQSSMCNSQNGHFSCFEASLEKFNADGTWTRAGGLVDGQYITFPANGTKLRLRCDWTSGWDASKYYRAIIMLDWTALVPTNSIKPTEGVFVGGIRVKKISDSDPTTKTTREKEFSYTYGANDEHSNTSSGVIMLHPMAQSTFLVNTDLKTIVNILKYGSPTVLSNSLGSYALDTDVHYRKVTVIDKIDGKINGKIEHYFTDAYDQPDPNLALCKVFPFAPSTPLFWRRGLKLKEVQSKYENSAFKVVKENRYYYKFNDEEYHPARFSLTSKKANVQSAAFNLYHWIDYSPTETERNYFYYHPFINYQTYTESFFLKDVEQYYQGSSTKQSYDQDSKSLESRTSMENLSDGQSATTFSKYSVNYSTEQSTANSSSAGIKLLVEKNMIVPIERYTVRSIGGVQYVTGGTLKLYHATKPVVSKEYTLELEKPLALTEFNESYIDGYGEVIFDENYKLSVTYDLYDANGNLLQYQASDRIVRSILWGYGGAKPIAQISGASYQDVVAHLTVSPDNLKTIYDDAQLRDIMATLRSSFQQMPHVSITSSTYLPLVGVTSESDENGKTRYFEYDGFSRLKTIRDHNQSILKHFSYGNSRSY